MQHVASQIHNCFASHPRIDVAFADCELLIGLICQVMLFLDDAVLIGPANPQHQIELQQLFRIFSATSYQPRKTSFRLSPIYFPACRFWYGVKPLCR